MPNIPFRTEYRITRTKDKDWMTLRTKRRKGCLQTLQMAKSQKKDARQKASLIESLPNSFVEIVTSPKYFPLWALLTIRPFCCSSHHFHKYISQNLFPSWKLTIPVEMEGMQLKNRWCSPDMEGCTPPALETMVHRLRKKPISIYTW